MARCDADREDVEPCAPRLTHQTVAQCVEDALSLPLAKRLTQSPATAANEEPGVSGRRNTPRTLPSVAPQRFDIAGMYGQLARLGELGLPYREDSLLQIDIGITQMNGFRDPQAGGCHQAEQGLVGRWAQAPARRAGPPPAIDDLLTNMRCYAPGLAKIVSSGTSVSRSNCLIQQMPQLSDVPRFPVSAALCPGAQSA